MITVATDDRKAVKEQTISGEHGHSQASQRMVLNLRTSRPEGEEPSVIGSPPRISRIGAATAHGRTRPSSQEGDVLPAERQARTGDWMQFSPVAASI